MLKPPPSGNNPTSALTAAAVQNDNEPSGRVPGFSLDGFVPLTETDVVLLADLDAPGGAGLAITGCPPAHGGLLRAKLLDDCKHAAVRLAEFCEALRTLRNHTATVIPFGIYVKRDKVNGSRLAGVPTVSHKLSPSWLKAVGHRLGEAMSDADFTQKDLEHTSGVSQGNISLLLNAGRETGGTLLNAIRLANALRVRVGWLLEGEGLKRADGVLPPPKPTPLDPKAETVDVDEESRAHVPVRAKHGKK